jgi:hypothetical protein
LGGVTPLAAEAIDAIAAALEIETGMKPLT